MLYCALASVGAVRMVSNMRVSSAAARKDKWVMVLFIISNYSSVLAAKIQRIIGLTKRQPDYFC